MDMQPITDIPSNTTANQLLMAEIACGDELALAELYARFSRLAYAIAFRITQDRAIAEEVVQDTFHSVWRAAQSFQPAESVAAWICGIARHRAIDATRSRVFRAREREECGAPAMEPSAEELIDVQVERRLICEQVRLALCQLHPSQREVLRLAYYCGLSHAEIAAWTGAPLGTVKARQRLAMIQLRRRLAPLAYALT